MTRDQLQRTYPDLYQFFRDFPEEHPFWVELAEANTEDVANGRTLLEDLEQVFSSLKRVQGRELFVERIAEVHTREELFELLTKLYVAYLYRDHGARFIQQGNVRNGYDVEVQIADQLLALGVVRFHSFGSFTEQFAAVIADEVKQQHAEEFLGDLESYSKEMPQHDSAHHQVLASVSDHALLPNQTKLSHHITEHHAELRERFPMVAGVLLVDPRPGIEKASFIPFHEGNEYLEQLLDKSK